MTKNEHDKANEPVTHGKRVTPQEAALAICDDVEESPAVDLHVQHMLRFCTEVCGHLGLDPNPVNLQRVADALKDAGIEAGHPEEFPKWLGRDEQGCDVIAEDADDEAEKSPLVVPDEPKVGKKAA